MKFLALFFQIHQIFCDTLFPITPVETNNVDYYKANLQTVHLINEIFHARYEFLQGVDVHEIYFNL